MGQCRFFGHLGRVYNLRQATGLQRLFMSLCLCVFVVNLLVLIYGKHMCGIVGIVRNDGRPIDEQLLSRMCNAIRHRGPDDDGFYVNGSVGLAMRRLAIIDLKSGQQPIHNQDRSSWIVFNGEIYNYLELREKLEKLGHTFYTNSDTEAIVHAYDQFGTDCPKHLRGMFALRDLERDELRNCFSRAIASAKSRCCMRT